MDAGLHTRKKMGMFDEIMVPKSYLKGLLTKEQEKLLKTSSRFGGSVRGIEFQTKSLENCLHKYKIYKQKLFVNDKVLWNCEPPATEERTEDTPKKYPYEKGRWEKVDHNGSVLFYDSIKDKDENTWWVEFDFVFNNGVIDKKELISFRLESTKKESEEVQKMWDTEQEILDAYRKNSLKYKFFSRMENRFQKMTNWARNKHRIPLEIRKEAYEKSGRLKKDPECLDIYKDL